MENELKSLSEVFQKRLFRIPDYQRGYAWKSQQLIDFWEDLVNINTRFHYTGLLSLQKVEFSNTMDEKDQWMNKKGFEAYHIVDGQQRITTMVILINEIVNFIKNIETNIDKDEEEIIIGVESIKEIKKQYLYEKCPPNDIITTFIFEYEKDNPSSEYLRHRIFEESEGGTVDETYYTKNLEYAKNFFVDNLNLLFEQEGQKGIEDLYNKLTQKMRFNILEINDDYDVFVAFETMNNRGKQLTNLELLKNRLIYITTLFPKDILSEREAKALRAQVNKAWKEIYYQLGRNKNAPLSDDDYLKNHWIIYFTYSRQKGNDYIQYLLNKFSPKNIVDKKAVVTDDELLEVKSSTEYEEDIDENSLIVAEEDSEKLSVKELKDYINDIKIMAKYWYDINFPEDSNQLTKEEKSWIEKLNRIQIGYFRALVFAVVSRQDLESKKRIELFKEIERFIFVFFRAGVNYSSYKSSTYYAVARDIKKGKKSIEKTIEEIRAFTDKNVHNAMGAFENKINKYFEEAEGFYSWKKPLQYVLFEYESDLSKKNKIQKMSWEMFTMNEKDKISIEHILPQNREKPYWQKHFGKYNEDEVNRLSGTIGNLLALDQSINSALQNEGYDEKKKSREDGRRGYENGSHSEIEVSSKYDEWTAENIYERSIHLLKFMSKRWKLNLSEEQMKRLTNISFMDDEEKQ